MIRKYNPWKEIVMILDNFALHRSKVVRKNALQLNIGLAYHSTYSPDINQIEFLWKSVKRIVTRTPMAVEIHLIAVVKNTFRRFRCSIHTQWSRSESSLRRNLVSIQRSVFNIKL